MEKNKEEIEAEKIFKENVKGWQLAMTQKGVDSAVKAMITFGNLQRDEGKPKWIDCKERPPKFSDKQVVGYSPEWIDENFNVSGTRLCYLSGDSLWVSSRWNPIHDVFDTDWDSVPTHWTEIEFKY